MQSQPIPLGLHTYQTTGTLIALHQVKDINFVSYRFLALPSIPIILTLKLTSSDLNQDLRVFFAGLDVYYTNANAGKAACFGAFKLGER
jgi:hypothetical protein